MNCDLRSFFQRENTFSDVLSLHETHLTYEMVKEKDPSFLREWFEMMRLDHRVRFEFFRDYWLNSLAFTPHTYDAITHFFSRVEDIMVYLMKSGKDAPYVSNLIYCMKEESDFFLGALPLNEKQIEQFAKECNFPLPIDYLHFLRIHNGFRRSKDAGIISSWNMSKEMKEHSKVFPFYPSFLDWLLFYIDVHWCCHG